MAAPPATNTLVAPTWVFRAALPKTHIANFDGMLKNVDQITRDALTRITHLRNEMKIALDNENASAGIAVYQLVFWCV